MQSDQARPTISPGSLWLNLSVPPARSHDSLEFCIQSGGMCLHPLSMMREGKERDQVVEIWSDASGSWGCGASGVVSSNMA